MDFILNSLDRCLTVRRSPFLERATRALKSILDELAVESIVVVIFGFFLELGDDFVYELVSEVDCDWIAVDVVCRDVGLKTELRRSADPPS